MQVSVTSFGKECEINQTSIQRVEIINHNNIPLTNVTVAFLENDYYKYSCAPMIPVIAAYETKNVFVTIATHCGKSPLQVPITVHVKLTSNEYTKVYPFSTTICKL